MAEIEDAHWWFAARRRIIASAVERLCRLPAGARILDVGSATGGTLGTLARFGRVVGIELDAEAAAFARSRGAAAVCRARLPEELPFREESFDLVTALDVIEHLDDDRGALAALARALRPGGALLVTVPAFQWLWSPHDDMNHHRRRYRRAELMARLDAAGLRVEHATYFNTWLFPLLAAARLANVKSASGFPLPPRPLNALLRAIFASERALVTRLRLPFGASILACARKPVAVAGPPPSSPGAKNPGAAEHLARSARL
jgi:SAM-dependent methyltransferase